MGKFVHFADTLSTQVATWVGWLIPLSVVVIAVDVIIRYFISKYTLIWPFDLNWMLFSFYFLLAAPYCLKVKGHVRIDIISARWPIRVQSILDIVYSLIFIVPIVVVIIIYSVLYAADSVAILETWNAGAWLPPIYPIKTLIPLAFALLLLQVIAEIVKSINIVKRGSEI